MFSKDDWKSLGWSTEDDGTGGFTASRDSSTICERCNMPGPWYLRILLNGELAHQDYAVCCCGELRHTSTVWPDAPGP
ncbi:MAG: hypothetical protein F4Y82_05415 [Cenarchaeum sp. SB0665_bin_23]|nr:hypothetical protein [Cenarchaeum sp. SB0667_bin_13]MXY61530.1 hypothetical protein [Cenarchaeum sp. SB0665_bin_23]MXZ93085.1 hypothetical protein [Cenarchaeum sp. SB0666_bin_15]MYB47604.1 hypothetical protein [Cenarchaeum sp. SB0662_bin_33]MYC79257.1 hypothetical protein [Cenarchaeum sp. SB0661_bin_35]MYD59184.1 hypothetical protein [Cenarchaeum sp. SB0678_bin_8]